MSPTHLAILFLALVSFGGGAFTGVWRSRRMATTVVSPRIARLAAKLHSLTTALADDMGSMRRGMDCCKQQLLEIQAEAAHDAATQAVADAIVAIITEIIERQSRVQVKLAEAEAALREQAAQIESYLVEAHTDALTCLLNRRALDTALERRYAQWARRRSSLSFLLLDVDHFKQLNDTYGHLAGDAVLRKLGEVLKKTARAMDVVARYGGEEFSIIVPDGDLAMAKTVAERVRMVVEACKFTHDGQALSVTVSVGVAELMVGEDRAALVDRADTALYAAKRAGRNRSYFHNGRKVLPVVDDKGAPAKEPPKLLAGAGDATPVQSAEVSIGPTRAISDVGK